jgi:hypothetical protein
MLVVVDNWKRYKTGVMGETVPSRDGSQIQFFPCDEHHRFPMM